MAGLPHSATARRRQALSLHTGAGSTEDGAACNRSREEGAGVRGKGKVARGRRRPEAGDRRPEARQQLRPWLTPYGCCKGSRLRAYGLKLLEGLPASR